jgi:Protein of unknown function (DUF3011)
MLRHWILVSLTIGACAAPAFAQSASRRANIVGNRGDEGKCTIEVRVDEVAEVEVNGDMGRIRTLSGQSANWVRFECTAPIPRNPADFRFKGIDGRGRVSLVEDPGSGRGRAAVVRIEDSKGGSEGYTFDLLWNASASSNDRYSDQYNDRYDDRRRGDNRRDSVVTCSSNDGRRRYCDADTSEGVILLREHGDSSCRMGSSWGFDRRGIWVDRGCRADFQLGR